MKKVLDILFINDYIYVISSDFQLVESDFVIDSFNNIGTFKGFEESPEWLLVEYSKGLCSEDLQNVKKIIFSNDPVLNLPLPEVVKIEEYSYILSNTFEKEEFGINLNSGSIFKFIDMWDETTLDVKFITGGNIAQKICTESWSDAKPMKVVATDNPKLVYYTEEI